MSNFKKAQAMIDSADYPPARIARPVRNEMTNEVERHVRRLPNDVARCAGSGNDEEGWREGCDVCLRRLSVATGERVVRMLPPPIIVFECEYLIDA